MPPSLHRRGWLPREGFHADVLGRVIRGTALNPLLTLPLWFWYAYVPRGQQTTWEKPNVLKYARLLAILSTIRAINNWLDRRNLNNGVVDKYDWTKEIVVVTGGSDGIGARVVHGLAQHRIKTIILDVQPLTYQRPPNVYYFACDLTNPSAIEDACRQIKDSVGAPTILINNAGVCRGRNLLDTTDDDLRLTFDVNTHAHYRLVKQFLPEMIKRDHGMIVTVASSAAWVTAPRMTEYAASKAAALSFHEGLTAELVTEYSAPRVRTVVVCQGYTRTPLFQGFGVPQHAFLGPSLHVDTLAEAIVNKVLSGTSGHLVLPGLYNHFAAHIRSLPWWLQRNLRMSLHGLMKDWQGRQVTQGGISERANAGI